MGFRRSPESGSEEIMSMLLCRQGGVLHKCSYSSQWAALLKQPECNFRESDFPGDDQTHHNLLQIAGDSQGK